MGQYGIGQSVKRFEDPRLVRGEGRFHNDVNLPGQAYVVVVRSLHAHARIRSIGTTAAAALPAYSRSSPGPIWRGPASAR
jgi:carbon-monoxide dehydrogenase large subunit